MHSSMYAARYVFGSQLVAIAFAASGCGAPTDSYPSGGVDQTATTERAIINGTTVSRDAIGTPLLENTPLLNGGSDWCTSTLLRDRWLLTASHCVTIGGTPNFPLTEPANLHATIYGSTATASGLELFTPGELPPRFDVALVKLDATLPAPSGHAEPFETRLYSGSTSSLIGHTYYCQGWGYSSCTTQDLGLRSANLRIAYGDSAGFTITPNSLGQIQHVGDSGGSCYQVVNGHYNVLGIQANGQCGVSESLTSAELARDWVDSVIDRVGMSDWANTAFLVKEGGLDHAWVAQYSDAMAGTIAGPRVAMIRQSDGHCLVKEGDFSNTWVDQWASGGVVACLLDGSRIGVLTRDAIFRVKDGSISSTGWVTQSTNVAAAALSGNRIGVLKTDGHFYVKDGGLYASWVDEYSNVRHGVLSGSRIGVVTNDSVLRVKEGGLYAGWVVQYSNVQEASLSGNRIGVLGNDGHFYVKEGGLSGGSWVDEYSNVMQGTLSGKRIGVVANEGSSGSPVYRYRVKEGDLSAGWVVQSGDSSLGWGAVLPSK